MKQYKFITITLAFMSVFITQAQQKLEKASQSIKADKEAIINLNTNYTNIEIDTWSKDIVEIEAYIESENLTKEELQIVLDNWDVEIEGSGDNITIVTSGSKMSYDYNYNYDFVDHSAFEALHDLQFDLADLPEMPVMPEMPEMPEMSEMPEMPEMPELPELPEGIHSVNFDTEAYKKDGEKYMAKWSKDYEKKYGKEYKDRMEEWAKVFSEVDFDAYSKEMEIWGEKFGESFGKDMEEWGEEFAKRMEESGWEEKMEKWGEDYGERFGEEFEKEMEEREHRLEERQHLLEERQEELTESMERRHEERARSLEKRQEHLLERTHGSRNSNVIKTIKIKMPKKAKLKMNMRHGELKFASVIHNARADLSYTTLIANSIDGRETSINASYSPVIVTNWNLGELKLNYVEKAQLNNVNRLMLNSNSSNLILNELAGTATINGSFGDFEIRKFNESFNNLTLVLENSDALIYLPTNNDFNLQYQGNRSHLKHPKNTSKSNITSFTTGNFESNKTIVVNAKYSDIIIH